MIEVMSISGSLRRESSNTTILKALSRVAPPEVRVTLFDGLGALPPFNPDVEMSGEIPPFVREFQDLLRRADAVVMCSPEYAHGVPGVLKNALDWVVSDGTLVGKPVASINAASWSTFAQASLLETLRVMNWRVVEEASVTLPSVGRRLDVDGIAAHPELSAILAGALAALVSIVKNEE